MWVYTQLYLQWKKNGWDQSPPIYLFDKIKALHHVKGTKFVLVWNIFTPHHTFTPDSTKP